MLNAVNRTVASVATLEDMGLHLLFLSRLHKLTTICQEEQDPYPLVETRDIFLSCGCFCHSSMIYHGPCGRAFCVLWHTRFRKSFQLFAAESGEMRLHSWRFLGGGGSGLASNTSTGAAGLKLKMGLKWQCMHRSRLVSLS